MIRPKQNLGILKSFLKDKIITVPTYQRMFTWEKNQSKIFLNDIFEYIEKELENDIQHNSPIHFLGTLYVVKDGMEYEINKFQIVDGQQRTTSFFLLLSAIKRIVYKNMVLYKGYDNNLMLKKEIIKYIDEILYIETEDDLVMLGGLKLNSEPWTLPKNNDKLMLKFRPQGKDIKLFYKAIVPLEQKNTKYNFTKTVLNFEQMLQEKLDNECHKDFELFNKKYISSIMNKIEIIFVELDSMTDAYSTFERLNDRGVKLTVFELLNVKLLNIIKKDEQQEKYSLLRDEIVKLCKKNGIKPSYALWQHYLIKYGVSQEKEISEKYKDKLKTFEDIMNELNELKNTLLNYEKLFIENDNNFKKYKWLQIYKMLKGKYFNYIIAYLVNAGLDEEYINYFCKKSAYITWTLSVNKTSMGSELNSKINNLVNVFMEQKIFNIMGYDSIIDEHIFNKTITKQEHVLFILFLNDMIENECFDQVSKMKIEYEGEDKKIKNISNIENLQPYITIEELKDKLFKKIGYYNSLFND